MRKNGIHMNDKNLSAKIQKEMAGYIKQHKSL